MCVVIDLDVVCLICLQPSKEMHPIFTSDADNSELQIAQKISILSELKIDQNNQTLPTKICTKCLQDLKAAWRFRKNCQAAVTIFQTIVKLDDAQPEDFAAKELEECALESTAVSWKVPQGLQIKRVEHSNEGDEYKKAKESLVREKSTTEEEFIVSDDKKGSVVYEEVVPHEYAAENHETEINEFQALEELGEANDNDEEDNDDEDNEDGDDDENNFVEYYITDDALTNEPTIKFENRMSSKTITTMEQKQSTERKQEQSNDKEAKESKLTKLLATANKPLPRGRPRRSIVNQKADTATKSTSKPSISTQVAAQTQSKTVGKTINSENSKPAQPQVRQVRTRKRKSLSPDTKPPKICELCGNSYRFQHALNAHMRRHYNDKPFPCEFCDKAFVSNVELRRHMRVHTGQKPYGCQYCERRFSDFGSRIKHERTHTGERPYHCNTCGKSFAYPHVLSVHLRTHTGEKRFRCDFCSKGFTKKAYLLTHMEQHHRGTNNFQVVSDDTADNSQMDAIKAEMFEECVYTTELVSVDGAESGEYDEDGQPHDDKIIITQSVLQVKADDEEVESEDNDEEEVHEIVEVQPDEYTIRIR